MTADADGQYYMTQPSDDELPRVLPEGSRSSMTDMSGWTLNTGLAPSGESAHSPFYRGSPTMWNGACHVDWRTVLRPVASQQTPDSSRPEPGSSRVFRNGVEVNCRKCGRLIHDDHFLVLTEGGVALPGGVHEFCRSSEPGLSPEPPKYNCTAPGCPCPYCRHRAHSPKLGANDPRYNDGRGPTHSTIDQSIALAKAQHLADLDRSSASRRAAIGASGERTWRDRMNRLVSWTGPVRGGK
jgi:hypothetical protein